jgi:hypothetical protein
MIVVEVGDQGTKYHVHKALLTENSEYFKKALNGRWKESQEGLVRLEDVSCHTCMFNSSADLR